MQEKLGKLGISQEVIEDLDRRSHVFKKYPIPFIGGVFKRIKEEQRELYEYIQLSALDLDKEEDLLAYNLGVALTYNMLPKFHIQIPLTADNIIVVMQTFKESIVFKEQDGEREPIIDLLWFMGKLREDSPAFMVWLGNNSAEIENMIGKEGFLKGAIHASLPFFMREEAKEMERKLYR